MRVMGVDALVLFLMNALSVSPWTWWWLWFVIHSLHYVEMSSLHL